MLVRSDSICSLPSLSVLAVPHRDVLEPGLREHDGVDGDEPDGDETGHVLHGLGVQGQERHRRRSLRSRVRCTRGIGCAIVVRNVIADGHR